jgi:biotin carboxyl carrier protein
MKMETVIRSPQKGVVAKLVHKEGVSNSSSMVIFLMPSH